MCLNFIMLCILLVNQVFGLPVSSFYHRLKTTSQEKCPLLNHPILLKNDVLNKCDSVDSKLLDVEVLSTENEDAVLCHVYLSLFEHLCEKVGNNNYESVDLSQAENLKVTTIEQVCSSLGNVTDSILKYQFISSAFHSPKKCDRLCSDYTGLKDVCSWASFMWTFSEALESEQKQQKKPEVLRKEILEMPKTSETDNYGLKPRGDNGKPDVQLTTDKKVEANENQQTNKLELSVSKSEQNNELEQLPYKKSTPVQPEFKLEQLPYQKSPPVQPESKTTNKPDDTSLNKGNGENNSPSNTAKNLKSDNAAPIPASPPESSAKNNAQFNNETIKKLPSPNSMKTTQSITSEGSHNRPDSAHQTNIESNKNQEVIQISTNLDKPNIDHKKEENKLSIQNNESKGTTGQVKEKEVKKENDIKDQVDEAQKEGANYELDDDGDDFPNENEEPEKKQDKKKESKGKSIYGNEPPPKPSEVPKPLETDEDSLNLAANFQNQNIDDSNSYFFSYFMMVCVMFICGYVAYHNKQKILALVLEGRKSRRPSRSRRPNSANYRKLDTTLEEAVTSSCNKNTTQVIY